MKKQITQNDHRHTCRNYRRRSMCHHFCTGWTGTRWCWLRRVRRGSRAGRSTLIGQVWGGTRGTSRCSGTSWRRKPARWSVSRTGCQCEPHHTSNESYLRYHLGTVRYFDTAYDRTQNLKITSSSITSQEIELYLFFPLPLRRKTSGWIWG